MNWAWTWFHLSPFACNEKSVNHSNSQLAWFWMKNLSTLFWFHMKMLKLRDLDMKGISQRGTKVKHDSVKCWQLISSVNFSVNMNLLLKYVLYIPGGGPWCEIGWWPPPKCWRLCVGWWVGPPWPPLLVWKPVGNLAAGTPLEAASGPASRFRHPKHPALSEVWNE